MITWPDFKFPGVNLYNYPRQNRDYIMSEDTTVYPVWRPKNPICTSVPSPKHYTHSTIETWDAIEAWGLNFNLGNVVKYISRAGHKGDTLEDLKKARAYLNREIDKLIGKV